MAQLRTAQTEAFARKLARHIESKNTLTSAYDGAPVPHGLQLDALVLELLGIARTFDITTELAAGQFVVLGVLYARKFYGEVRVLEILRNKSEIPQARIQRVLNAVIVAESRAH